MPVSARDSNLARVGELLHQSFDRPGETPLDTTMVQLMLELSRARPEFGAVRSAPRRTETFERVRVISGTMFRPLAVALQRVKSR